jgi:hypothetical protein
MKQASTVSKLESKSTADGLSALLGEEEFFETA